MIVEINLPNAGPAMQSACDSTSTTLHSNPSEVKYETLAERSPGDRPWDVHRAANDRIAAMYHTAEEFERYGSRMNDCSGRLDFAMRADDDGVIGLRLSAAHFCRVRFCPVCQWRRSLMWKARFYKSLPDLVAAVPGGRWLFLTLTVQNCAVGDLRARLGELSKAWGRLVKMTVFKDVEGWVRTVEVTRGRDGSAHPHYHVLLLVKSTYFKPGHYITQAQWGDAWKAAARLPYDPIIDVRAVRSKGATGSTSAVSGAIAETLKYAVKPSDMEADAEWFFELTRQLHRLRFVAAGGVLKDVFKDEETEADLLVQDENPDGSHDLGQLTFNWAPSKQHYRRKVGP